MTIKIYDRDSRFTAADVAAAQTQLNAITPGINKSRMTTFGRFELPLTGDLTGAQQADFLAWAAANYPDWEIVIR